MDTLLPQDIVKNFKFDQSFEDTAKLLDTISEKDLALFENLDFSADISNGFFQSDEEMEPPMSHVQSGVLCFNVNKMLRTDQIQICGQNLQNYHEPNFSESSRVKSDFAERGSANLSCDICGKLALKYSSYGGLACTSCRSFFRRSARENCYMKYKCAGNGECWMKLSGSRQTKKCQLCRFNKCLESGMRVTWVLSTQERARRFTKASTKAIIKTSSQPLQQLSKPLVVHFSTEEQLLLEHLNSKFEIPWLEYFFFYNQLAALNWIEYTFCNKDLDLETWKVLGDSMKLGFSEILMPKLQELWSTELSFESSHVLCGQSSAIVNFFRSCFAVRITSSNGCQGIMPYLTSLQGQVPAFIRNQRDVLDGQTLDALTRTDALDASNIRVVSCSQLYPNADKISPVVKKVQSWPLASDGQWIPHLITLMSLILIFSCTSTLDSLTMRIFERHQLHYSLILQRFLRFHLQHEREANEKFLEAMLLIADVKEATETKAEQSVITSHNTLS